MRFADGAVRRATGLATGGVPLPGSTNAAQVGARREEQPRGSGEGALRRSAPARLAGASENIRPDPPSGTAAPAQPPLPALQSAREPPLRPQSRARGCPRRLRSWRSRVCQRADARRRGRTRVFARRGPRGIGAGRSPGADPVALRRRVGARSRAGDRGPGTSGGDAPHSRGAGQGPAGGSAPVREPSLCALRTRAPHCSSGPSRREDVPPGGRPWTRAWGRGRESRGLGRAEEVQGRTTLWSKISGFCSSWTLIL